MTELALEKIAAPIDSDRVAYARRLSMKYSSADAVDILAVAVRNEFKARIALVSSFGAESAVLLHIAAQVDRTIPVIFLETGKHFVQTLSYQKKLTARLGLVNVLNIAPNADALSARDRDGDLWRRDADACCKLRKVDPLSGALAPYDAWITGRKQFHGGGRDALPTFEANNNHIKVNPLLRWTPEDIDKYLRAYDLPRHPLVAQGYPSIGCWPCTHPVAEGADIRSGRWRGSAKTECGIHRIASVG
ncbi:MAG: phosphoadenylyl-sulfate reductase [Marinicaulis sp.]|nr:phosphoadenylyl-sulfate reductase [Marinicaulis sp.]